MANSNHWNCNYWVFGWWGKTTDINGIKLTILTTRSLLLYYNYYLWYCT